MEKISRLNFTSYSSTGMHRETRLKINELIEAINKLSKPVETTNEQPTITRAECCRLYHIMQDLHYRIPGDDELMRKLAWLKV